MPFDCYLNRLEGVRNTFYSVLFSVMLLIFKNQKKKLMPPPCHCFRVEPVMLGAAFWMYTQKTTDLTQGSKTVMPKT